MRKVCGDEPAVGWLIPKCGHTIEQHYHYGCSICPCPAPGNRPAPQPKQPART